MLRYFVNIGSNINPHYNIVNIIHALFPISSVIHISRIVETEPVGLKGGDNFLNLSVCLYTNLPSEVLKQKFNEIEAQLGRDRSDANRGYKSRTADLDILFALKPKQISVPRHQLPTEPYMRPMLVELLHWLGVACDTAVPPIPPGVPLQISKIEVGHQPLTIKHEGLKNGGEILCLQQPNQVL